MSADSQPDYDVIVVGAGPAGCRAAWVLGQTGRRVLLLDRKRFPRWKPCAGGITAKAAPYIPQALRSQFQRTMRGAILTWGDRHSTHVTADSPLGWTVHRESFDEAHLTLVRALPGVEVIEGAPVRQVEQREDRVLVRTGDREHAGRIVVGADGVNSVVSRCLPGHDERSIGFAYEGEARFEPPGLESDVLFDFRTFPSGYGWVFPKRDHYSIGGYVFEGGVKRVAELYDEFCAGSSRLAGCETYRRRGYRIPHGGKARRLNGARVLLAGDAGDLVDPLSGEGIYYALRSGQLAAEAALEFFAGHASLDAYGDQVQREIQSELRYALKLAGVVLRHRRAAFFLLLKNRTVCRWNIEILAGRKSYSSLRDDLRRRAWLLPLQFRPAARQSVVVKLA